MTDDERKQTRPFADWLREHKHGSLHAELSEHLADLASAVMEHGKGGSLTLTIKMQTSKGGMIEVTDDLKPNLPKADRGGSLFWADAEGNLSRQDPNQMELEPLRVIETTNEEPVILDTATGEIRSI